ncbi:hypothetical protein LEP1GSC072_0699 [Leptospira noguchii str. Bonito]|nr:hypothetical protein LEP1GSC072_0699 [Leptospira noguchii str. Bonito]
MVLESKLNSAKHSLWVVFKLSKTLPMGRVQTQQNTPYGSCFRLKNAHFSSVPTE